MGEQRPRMERNDTDSSLQRERDNSDRVLAERFAATADEADAVVDRARADADAVVGVARDRADRQNESGGTAVSREDVAQQRALEDGVLRDERAAADEALARQRTQQARALHALLPLERERTDLNLLTERARSDDALAHRDDFLAMVSHDLRNLLAGIVLSASSIAEDGGAADGPARTIAGLDRIQRYAARMNRLVGDLLDVASIDAGKLVMKIDRGDAATLLAEVVDAFAGAAAARGVTLRWEAATVPLTCSFDHERLFQVLANLITNALKFTPRGGSVVARGACSVEGLHLAVRDTGSGISPHLLEAVFERFWQAGKHDRRGLGLGLHISRSLVEAHGGRIWAESVPGEGSTFHVTLPATAA